MTKKIAYSEKDKNINEELYTYFLANEAPDGWDDRDKFANFRDLVLLASYAHCPLENASVLDVGCGTGDMSAFLMEHGVTTYTGIDVFKAGITVAKDKYPNATFLVGDFLDYTFTTSFDFVFCSGALTTRLHSDNYDVLPHWIQKMWSLATHGFAFNFLAEENPGQFEEDLFLYNINRVIAICDELVPDATREAKMTRTGDKREYLQVHMYFSRHTPLL